MLHKVLTVKYITLKTCFCYLSEQNFKLLDQGITVKLSYGENQAYFSAQSLSGLGENEVGINGLQAQALGLLDNESITVTCEHISGIRTITISPASADDYEVLELLAENVELTLLNQIRVVNRNQKIVIWISNSLHITVNVDDAQPVSPGRLDNLTEVAIAKPKISKSEKHFESYDTDLTSSIRSVVKYFTKDLRPPSPVSNDILSTYGDCFSPLTFALHPVTDLNCYPRKSGFSECTQHFNVFVHKHHLPIRFCQLNTLNETIVVILFLIPPASDEQNERHSRKFAVRLCAIEDFFETQVQVKQHQTKLLYAHDCIVKFYNVKPGVKVVLKKLEPASPPEIKSIRILTTGNNIKVAEECFKLFVNKGCESGKIVLNPKIFLEFSQEFSCSLQLVPENAHFCLVDPDFVRNCRFKVEESEINVEEKRDEKAKGATEDSVCTEVGNFDEILKRSLMVFEHGLITCKTTVENVLITGKVCSGKSSLTRIIQEKLKSATYRIHTESVSCERLKGKTPDSLYSKLTTLFSNCMYYQPSVLILDNLQAICEKVVDDDVHTQDAEHYNRISEELADMIKTYSKHNLIAILATAESTSKLNSRIFGTRGQRQLFKNVFNIADLDKTDRSKLLQVLFRKKCSLEEVDLDEIAVKTEGFVAQDFVDFTNKAVFESFKEENDQLLPVVKPHHCDAVFPKMSALFLKGIKLHSPGERNFSDIGGLDDVKAVFIEHLLWPIKYPNIFGKAPIRLQSGLLLYGPPGTGKTILAGAAAKQCGFRLMAVKGPELLTKYIGASEEAVRNIFQKAQAAKPCILFFDEFDSLAPRRGHDSTGVSDRVVNQFLTQLDGVETLTGVCVLAATSRPDLLDPALLRPGRLDKQILCPLPDEKARLEILKVLSKDANLSPEARLGEVAVKTEGYSGADLQAILYTAQMNALDGQMDGDEEEKDFSEIQIMQTHLENAVSTTRPSLSKTERLKFDAICQAFQQGGDLTTYLKQNQQQATLA